MNRNKQKQNLILRAKSDAPSVLSPKKDTIAYLTKILHAQMEAKPVPASRKALDVTCNPIHFNSPRKKYLPDHHQRNISKGSQASIVQQIKKEESYQQEKKLAKILLLERKNLQQQKQFLLREEEKIDRENDQLRERISKMTERIREMQTSQSVSNELQRYITFQKCDKANMETKSSDFFKAS